MTRAVKDSLAGLPLWVKAVGLVGLPGTLCFALIYLLYARDASATALGTINTKLDSHMSRMEDMNGTRTDQMETLIRLARLQCVAAQKTEEGVARCLE